MSADEPTDTQLLAALRRGHADALDVLYRRHAATAHRVAWRYADSPAQAQDLVSTAVLKVLAAVRGGRGPTTDFRAYLLAAVRHAGYTALQRERRIDVVAEPAAAAGVATESTSPAAEVLALAALECALAAGAFAALPPRWRAALWHIEIEGRSRAELAAALGLRANAAGVLAHRAREGLRQAYLHAHLGTCATPGCHDTHHGLVAWTRRTMAPRRSEAVAAHLQHCPSCRVQAAGLAQVAAALPDAVGSHPREDA